MCITRRKELEREQGDSRSAMISRKNMKYMTCNERIMLPREPA